MTYTQEQIDEAKKWLTTNDVFDPNKYASGRRLKYELILLATLEAVEKERDEARSMVRWDETVENALCRAEEELRTLKESDDWMEKAKEFYESGGCPICFSSDEEGHKDDCSWGRAEAYVSALEKAGDGMRAAPWGTWPDRIKAWDAARKSKP